MAYNWGLTGSTSAKLHIRISPFAFIQWITSLVATFRGLLIPVGQIIQIGLLRLCLDLMFVMPGEPPTFYYWSEYYMYIHILSLHV